jgi:hypothetical protein
MVIASLFALALAAAPDGPIATSPQARPPAPRPATSMPVQPPASAAAPARDPEIPASAPTDDYGFVAWCHGALSGHMELHDRVKPELDKVSPGGDDTELAKAGADYLSLYATALKEAEAASPQNIHERGVEANAAGYRIWAAARAAEPRTQMWSYLMWELPPRCEIAAKRLAATSSLLGQALKAAPGQKRPPAPKPEARNEARPTDTATAAPQTIGLRGAQ